VQGISSPDEFLGLEITAKHQEDKLKQAAKDGNTTNAPEVIHI